MEITTRFEEGKNEPIVSLLFRLKFALLNKIESSSLLVQLSVLSPRG